MSGLRRRVLAAVGAAVAIALVSGCAPSPPEPTPASAPALSDPAMAEIAHRLVSSAENSSLDWRAQYAYIEDIGDGRGYTAGIIGFTTGTGDLLELVRRVDAEPLAAYLPALEAVDGTDSHEGLDPGFADAWRTAAADPAFQRIQDDLRDEWYFDPAVELAEADGLQALGQFAYYDAAVVHGFEGLQSIRAAALELAGTPADGGDEAAYLEVFLDEREVEMRTEEAHEDTTRVSTAQRRFLREGNLTLSPPLRWEVYGDPYEILELPSPPEAD